MPDSIAGPPVEYVHSPRVTGADIPEELFENILRFSPKSSGKYNWRDERVIEMPELLPLTFVCRYFAKTFRPLLYRHVVLNSARKLKGLIYLDSCDNPLGCLLLLTKTLEIQCGDEYKLCSCDHPSTYLCSHRIQLGDRDNFWVHRIFTVLLPRIVHAQCVHPFPDVEIDTNGPIPGLIPCRASLPRPIPPSLLRRITRLEVQSFKFKRGDDLLWCLSSFGGLKEVKMTACECEADATPAAVRRFLVRHGHLERFHFWGSRTCIPAGLLGIFCSEIRRADTTWCSPEKAEYRAIADMVLSLANIGRPEPEDIKVINYNGHIEIETRTNAIYRQPIFDYSFHMHLVHCGEERYDCGIVLQVGPKMEEEDTSSLLELWPKLANCMQNLRHVKQFSLKIEVFPDCWGWITAFMVDIRSVMQDLRASLSPGQCLVVDPPNPPRVFENEEDYERYPYLEQNRYPESVIAAMEEERQSWVEERKERKKKEEEAKRAYAKRTLGWRRRCSRCNQVHEMEERGMYYHQKCQTFQEDIFSSRCRGP